MLKKDAKTTLVCWVLFLQEFNIEMKEQNNTKSQVTDHLSRLKEDVKVKFGDEFKIDDTFLDEGVWAKSKELIPQFANFSNYLEIDLIPKDLSFQQCKQFMQEVHMFFGMSIIYFEFFHIELFGGVFLWQRWLSLLRLLIHNQLGLIMVVDIQPTKFCNIGTIEQLFTKILMIMLGSMISVSGKVIYC